MEKSYFWQGGQKVEIEKKGGVALVHAVDADSAFFLARKVGVAVTSVMPITKGLMKVRIRGDLDDSMAKLRVDNIVHHVYHLAGQPSAEVMVSDSFYLRFKAGTTEARMAQYLAQEGLHEEQKLDDQTLLVRVTAATRANAIKASNRAAESDDVEYAEPNVTHQLVRFADPTDPMLRSQWHLHAPETDHELVRGADIHAPQAWQMTRGSREIVIAVADDGFDLTHPDFKGADKIAGTIDVQPIGKGDIGVSGGDVHPRPGDYHGTPCAGVAVAEANGEGTVGVAPGCALLAVRFPLTITDLQLAKMFKVISERADIVSCSWGYPPTQMPVSRFLRKTLAQLARTGGRRGKGLVICVAAGNNNCPIKDDENTLPYQYQNQFGFLVTYSGPINRWIAAHPDVITVSASTSLKTRAAYSSWGDEVAVCAPSSNFHDLGKFQVHGRGIVTTDNEGFGPRTDFTEGSRFTSDFGGTSSATPTVAGVCGLVLSRNQDLTAVEVRDIVCKTADKDLEIASETPVNRPGAFDANGRSLWFGHGKVNAARAVRAARGDA